MNKKTRTSIALWTGIFSFAFFIIWHASAETGLYAQVTPEKKYSDTRGALPDFSLPVPQDKSEREYLGLSGKNKFRIGDINAQLVIIEVFSFYCPHCQAQAPKVKELFDKIKADPALRDTIKMIGIAATNSPFEARSFKEAHGVPFPVFSDEDSELAAALSIKYTPTFIGVRVNGKGSQEQFYVRPGTFNDTEQFLQEVLKTSGTDLGKK